MRLEVISDYANRNGALWMTHVVELQRQRGTERERERERERGWAGEKRNNACFAYLLAQQF